MAKPAFDPAAVLLNHMSAVRKELRSLVEASRKQKDSIAADLFHKAEADLENATRHVGEGFQAQSLRPAP